MAVVVTKNLSSLKLYLNKGLDENFNIDKKWVEKKLVLRHLIM